MPSPRLASLWWLVAGVACGVLVALSVPPFGWWPLAWVGFAGLAYVLPGRSPRQRLALGFGAGLGQYVLGLLWVEEFSVPGCVILMIVSALFSAVALLLVPTGRRRSVAIGLPALMVLADWVRDRYPLGGFPLGGASLGQADSPLAPTLKIGGSLLLTGVTVVCGVVLAEIVYTGRSWATARSAWSARRSGHRQAWATTAGAAGMALLVVVLVVLGDGSPSGAGGDLKPIRVALVQGGGKRGTRAIFTNPQVVFDRHLAASQNLRLPLNLVVWPEGVLQSHLPFSTGPDAAAVASLARTTDATVVVGVEQDVGDRHYLNEAVAWAPDGRIVGTYVKNHRVPFGEYVPYRSFIEKFVNIADVPYDAIPGHGPGILRTPAAPLGVMISYEVFFDGRARGAVRAGGQALVVPTDTASYRSTQVPTQELAAAELRARETGRWVLQVTETGYTAVVDPSGRVVEKSALDRQQVLYATVPLETGRTWYVDIGDGPVAWLALVLAALAWVLARPDAGARHADQWSRTSR
jgi:apolipoprotein N-acyltransferase